MHDTVLSKSEWTNGLSLYAQRGLIASFGRKCGTRVESPSQARV